LFSAAGVFLKIVDLLHAIRENIADIEVLLQYRLLEAAE
jgi:hypothetical protein